MNNINFIWKHHYNNCTLCGECVDTCNALSVTTLRRIKRDEELCTRCETCSTICTNIETGFQNIKK